VSDPPNYPACVASLEEVANKHELRPENLTRKEEGLLIAPRPTPTQLLSKCRRLHQALRLQALDFLVEAQWTIALYAELGVTVSDAEVRQLFNTVRRREFPTEQDLKRYLAGRGWTLSDELYSLKLNVLAKKVEQKMAAGKQTAGGKQMLTTLAEAGQNATAKTNCRAGYVVQHCKGYKGDTHVPYVTSPAVLMEQVATVAGRPCLERSSCG
jgi:hypothetical protein